MVLTNAFKEAVSSGNVRRVRIMMKDSILNDPTFSEFNEMNKAACNISELYDTHDGRNLNYDKNTWNDSYMNKLMVQIVTNFSHERMDHLKDVVRQLRPVATNAPTVQSDDKQKEYGGQQSGSYRGAKIAGGAIIGAAGGAIIGAAGGAIVGGAIAAAASGTVVAVSATVIAGATIGAVTGAVTGAAIVFVATKG